MLGRSTTIGERATPVPASRKNNSRPFGQQVVTRSELSEALVYRAHLGQTGA